MTAILTFLDAALRYAKIADWRLVLLHEPLAAGGCSCFKGRDCPSVGKHPRQTSWDKHATNDEAKLRTWYAQHPTANLGLLLGPESGVIDVEFDCDEGRDTAKRFGFDSIRTPTYKSARSIHRLFRCSEKLPDIQKKMVLGLEVRIGGGGKATQSVLPPSLHPTGVYYEWLPGLSPNDVEVASVPDVLIAHLWNDDEGDGSSKKPSRAREVLDRAEIPEGQRNDLLHLFACREAGRSPNISDPIEQDDLYAKLLALNVAKCKPALGETELKAIHRSAIKFILETADSPHKLAECNGVEFTTDLLRPIGRTDSANGRRLVAQYGQVFRWCDPWGKWLAWDGQRWAVDQECRLQQMGVDVAGAIWNEIGEMVKAGKIKRNGVLTELLRFARATASARGIRDMLTLARSEPGIAILPARLDTDPWVLNVANGTLDLRTQELRPHRQSDFITKLAPVKFDPTAACPNWLAFIDKIMGRNAALIGFLRRLTGYSLTGSVRENVLAILYGVGANGKSTLIGVLLELLGPDYAMKAGAELLMAKDFNSHTTERMDLFGKRLVAAIETEDGRRLAESLVKELTGGDRIRGRRMREDNWEYSPTHKIWLASNHKPVVHGTDWAIWRRIKMLPFSVVIPDDQQDKEFPEKLRNELPGILNWALAGCAEWQSAGLREPVEVTRATSDYRGEMDLLAKFLAECCVQGQQYTVRADSLYKAYRRWCEAGGEWPVTATRFGNSMRERNFEKHKSNGTWYLGVGVLGRDSED